MHKKRSENRKPKWWTGNGNQNDFPKNQIKIKINQKNSGSYQAPSTPKLQKTITERRRKYECKWKQQVITAGCG
jgi:hypothetical protein